MEKLSLNLTGKQRDKAHELFCAISSPVFLVSLAIISYYSAILEPVTQVLQSVSMDMVKARSRVQELIQTFSSHRQNAENKFHAIYEDRSLCLRLV